MEILIQTILPGESFSQNLPPGRCHIDIALGQSLVFGETMLPAESWQIQPTIPLTRQISNTGSENGVVVSLITTENNFPARGILSMSMIYDLLKMMVLIKETSPEHAIALSVYADALIWQIRQPVSRPPAVGFHGLRTVFELIEALNDLTQDFPAPAYLARQSGMKNRQFKLACAGLYHQSLKSILQHLKMKQAFKQLVIEHREIRVVSAALGYQHPENLTTAFHGHFGLAPAAAMTYNQA